MNSNETLVAETRALYSRMQSDTLTEHDILQLDDAIFEDHSKYIVKIRDDSQLFKKNFSQIIEPLTPFKIFKEDDTILEVGAHWGYSVVALRHLGIKSNIMSIEALPQNARTLAALKGHENGTYDFRQVAATESACDLTFYMPAINRVPITGLNTTGGTLVDYFADHLVSLVPTYPPKNGEPNRFQILVISVAGLPIDEVVEEREIADQIRGIKMDIEGHEASALRGASRLLDGQKPLIMVEGANRDLDVVDVMKSHGYRHHELRAGLLHLHEDYSMAQDGYWLHPKHFDFYRQSGLIA